MKCQWTCKWTVNIGSWGHMFCIKACFHQQTEQTEKKTVWAVTKRDQFHPQNCTGLSQRMSDAPLDLHPKIPGCGDGNGEWRWLSDRRWEVNLGSKSSAVPGSLPLFLSLSLEYRINTPLCSLNKQHVLLPVFVWVRYYSLMSELNQPGPIPPPTNLHPHPRKSIKHPHTYSHLRPPRLSTAPTLFLPSLWIFFFSLCPSFVFFPPSSL